MDEGSKDNSPVTQELDKSLDVFIDRKTLYHGSSVSGITKFDLEKEVDDTVGKGVYFTPDQESAEGYAVRRAKNRGGTPIVYESQVSDLRLANLTTDHNVLEVLRGFQTVLQEGLDKAESWQDINLYTDLIGKIKSGQIKSGNLRDVTFHSGKQFSQYLSSLGYDGVLAREGGEGSEVSNHLSYAIFDPEKVKILSEKAV